MDEPHTVSRYHELAFYAERFGLSLTSTGDEFVLRKSKDNQEWRRSRTLDEVEKRIEAFSVFTSGGSAAKENDS